MNSGCPQLPWCNYLSLFSIFVVSPLILFAPTLQILWRNSLNAKVECLVTGGKRTVDWWKNSLLIASTDPAISAHQGEWLTLESHQFANYSRLLLCKQNIADIADIAKIYVAYNNACLQKQ